MATADQMASVESMDREKLVDRIAELEALVSAMHSTGHRLSFAHEWYLEGVRRSPGEYVLMRIGRPAEEPETPF